MSDYMYPVNLPAYDRAIYMAASGAWVIDPHLGRIWSRHTGRELRGTPNEHGYRTVKLWLPESKTKPGLLIHRIIWLYHHGTIDPDRTLNHVDGCKTHNAIGNLEQVSRPENNEHARRVGLAHVRGESNGQAILTAAAVVVIRDMWEARELSQREIGDVFGVGQTAVHKAIHGDRWPDVPLARAPRPASRGPAKGSPRQLIDAMAAVDILRRHEAGETQAALAAEYGVSRPTISVVCRKERSRRTESVR